MAADETPVTLDDLATVGLERIEAEYHVDDLGICRRCGGVVFMSPYSEDTHRRWHAAIEDLTVTVSAEVPADFFDNSPPTITAKGSHMLRIPFTPDQRRDLVVTLGLDPNRADHCTWEAIMGRVRQHAAGAAASAQTDQPLRDHLIQRLTDGPAFRTETEVIDWLMPVIGVWRGEVERLRRIEDALIAVGAPNHSRRGDPGGLVVAWIQRQADLMAELKKQLVALPKSMREMHTDLVEALGLDQNTGFYAALDEVRELAGHRFKLNDALGIVGAEEDTDPYEAVVGLHKEVDRLRGLLGAVEGATQRSTGIGPKCVAHGTVRCVQCSLNPADCGSPSDRPGCVTYLADGVHWDTCPNRVQIVRDNGDWELTTRKVIPLNDPTRVERNTQSVEQAEAEVCPSLYLTATGHLVACQQPKVDEPDLHTAMLDGHRIAWREPDAVPSPWPVDQEPPAGINLLRDTGSQLVPYLARIQNGWGWVADPPNGPRTHGAIQWAEAVLDVDGDLVVVRP